jgi:hypothetical protein
MIVEFRRQFRHAIGRRVYRAKVLPLAKVTDNGPVGWESGKRYLLG